MNNKKLFLILLAFVAVYVIYRWTSSTGERTFDPILFTGDTAAVSRLVILPRGSDRSAFTLQKPDVDWEVQKEDATYKADNNAVGALLGTLSALRATYIVSKNKTDWATYELGIDIASQIEVYSGNRKLLHLFIGKVDVNQQKQSLIAFMRSDKSDNVYAVEGMASMMLAQGLDAYRDKQLLQLDISSIRALEYGGSAEYTVDRSEEGWQLNQTEPLDSSAVQNFLLNLRKMSGEEFVSDFDPERNTGKLFRTLIIHFSNEIDPIIINCWKDTLLEKPFVIQSSQFPESYFASDTTRIYKRIFKPISEW